MIQNGQFKKIAVKANGPGVRNAEEWKKAFLHAQGGAVYLLTHIQTINSPIEGISMHGMRCITHLDRIESYETFENIVQYYVSGVCIVISHDPEVIARVHGRNAAPTMARNEEAAPESSPYMLANYTQHNYRGFAGYHASHRETMNTPTTGYSGYRIGVELETEFLTEERRREFTNTPRNWYFCESDASLDNAGCEIITIPLIPSDAKSRKTWAPICERLKCLGATSWDNNNCGLHVHIGREILGSTTEEREATLSRILLFYNLYLNDDATATAIFGRARCYHERRQEQTQEFAAVKCLGASVLKDKEIAKRVGDAMKRVQSGDRYYTINTTNTHTIEFRKGRGSLSVDRIQSIITFCESVCLYCRTSDDVSELSLEGFRAWIRENVPASNSLYHYYEIIERDC